MDKDTYSKLLKTFTNSEGRLRAILCDIRTTIQNMGYMYHVVNPSIMKDKYKNDSLRDWIMFREYVNQLEYMKEVFAIMLDSINA